MSRLLVKTRREMPELFRDLKEDSVVVRCPVCGNEYWEDKKAIKTKCPKCKGETKK